MSPVLTSTTVEQMGVPLYPATAGVVLRVHRGEAELPEEHYCEPASGVTIESYPDPKFFPNLFKVNFLKGFQIFFLDKIIH